MVGGTDLFISLFNNLAIFIVLVAVYGFLNSHLANSTPAKRQLILGVAFGLFAIGCMFVKIPVAEGVIVDQRNTIVALSGAFGGPLSGAVCAAMTAAYRAHLGGGGVLGGIIGVCLSAIAGIVFFRFRHKIDSVAKASLYVLAATIFILPGFLFIKDIQTGWELMKAMALPYGTAVFIGLLFVGLLLAHEEHRFIAEFQLAKSEKRYRELFENLIDVSFRTDREGRLTVVSPSVETLLGYRPDEVLGEEIIGFYKDPSVFDEYIAEIMDEGQVENFDLEIRKKDGSYAWFSLNAKLIYGEDGSIIGREGIARDISKQKKAEEDKIKLEEQLRQSQKMQAIGTLASGVAHDFNNLLQSISGHAEMMKLDQRSDTSSRENLSQIILAVERAAELVRRLLTFSRKTDEELKPLDLNQEVQLVIKLLERTIPRMINIETHLDDGLWRVMGDSTKIEQVLMNLGANARDAMPQGGSLVIETRNFVIDESFAATHLNAEQGRYVQIMVSDTGEGMDKKTVQRMFEPFFTTKGPEKGTGLGLFTVYGIVTGMNGYISCYSEVGQGTVFNIYLPAQDRPSQDAQPDRQEPAPSLLAGDETILLVDDEPPIRELGKQVLLDQGYQVATASSGEEAIAAYRRTPDVFDLVIMDLGMPGMGGLAALKELMKFDRAAKIIIASGYSRYGQIKDTLGYGAAGYITKPFKLAELLKTVREVLDK